MNETIDSGSRADGIGSKRDSVRPQNGGADERRRVPVSRVVLGCLVALVAAEAVGLLALWFVARSTVAKGIAEGDRISRSTLIATRLSDGAARAFTRDPEQAQVLARAAYEAFTREHLKIDPQTSRSLLLAMSKPRTLSLTLTKHIAVSGVSGHPMASESPPPFGEVGAVAAMDPSHGPHLGGDQPAVLLSARAGGTRSLLKVPTNYGGTTSITLEDYGDIVSARSPTSSVMVLATSRFHILRGDLDHNVWSDFALLDAKAPGSESAYGPILDATGSFAAVGRGNVVVVTRLATKATWKAAVVAAPDWVDGLWLSDEGRLAVETSIGDLEIWDPPENPAAPGTTPSGLLHSRLPGDRVQTVLFGNNGHTVVTMSPVEICLWDADRRTLLMTFEAEREGTGAWRDVAFSTDKEHVAARRSDGLVVVWQVGSGVAQVEVQLAQLPQAAVFSTDLGSLVVADQRLVNIVDLRPPPTDEQAVSSALAALARSIRWPHAAELVQALGNSVPELTEGIQEARSNALDDAVRSFGNAELYDDVRLAESERGEAVRILTDWLLDDARKAARTGDVPRVASRVDSLRTLESGCPTCLVDAIDLLAVAKRRRGIQEIDRHQYDLASTDFTDAEGSSASVISASDWNRLCWRGAIDDQAQSVRFACDRAVTLDGETWQFRDSRGVARALSCDIGGAIEDFRFVVARSTHTPSAAAREEWLDELVRQGPQGDARKVFTPAVLKSLASE